MGQKLGGALLAALGAVLLVSLFLNLTPGDPVELLLGERAQQIDATALRHQMWLDRPLLEQAGLFLHDFVTGELKSSLPPFDERVLPRILRAVPRTAELGGLAIAWAVLLSLPLGLISAARVGRSIDRLTIAMAVLGVSAPSFLIGHALILAFGIFLGWLPISGDDQLLSVVLPSLTLGLGLAALLSRVIRAAILEVIEEDCILAARSRGLSELRVLLGHALRSALLPILTVLGLQLGGVLTGTIIVEKVFNWPGLGTLLLTSIEKRDFNSVRACVLVFTLTYLAVNLSTDLAYLAADPRARRVARP